MSKKAYIITILFLIVVILGLGGYIVYDKFFDVKEKNIKENQGSLEDVRKRQEENNKVKQEDNIPVSDKYALSINEDNTFELYVLDNGKLYYEIIDKWDNERLQTFESYEIVSNALNENRDYFKNKDLKQYNELTNIKRIKSVNTLSTGVSFNLLLITQDGKVYEFANSGNNEFYLKLLDIFRKYEVEDILKWESLTGCIDGMDSEECAQHFEILLKDGTTVRVP